MKKRGLTLLELIIVIIIIGILATLGFTQYTRLIEKARGAEARSILGDLRKKAAAYRLEHGTIAGITGADLDITASAGDIPSVCAPSHYFSYAIATAADPTITVSAARCAAGGKMPNANAPTGGQTLTLTTNLNTGVDTWGGTGPWD